MAAVVMVEMGETRLTRSADAHLQAHGLGACVGLCLYEAHARLAVLVHVVLPVTLPRSDMGVRPAPPPGKCADTAVAHALAEITRQGGQAARVQAALVGGAQIFTAVASDMGARSRLEIGQRNVHAVKEELARVHVPLCAEDTGGHFGRSVTLDAATGTVWVRPVGLAERVLVILEPSGPRVGLVPIPSRGPGLEGAWAYG
jgi:chemotaxis protein CheD